MTPKDHINHMLDITNPVPIDVLFSSRPKWWLEQMEADMAWYSSLPLAELPRIVSLKLFGMTLKPKTTRHLISYWMPGKSTQWIEVPYFNKRFVF